jgi:signal transduction histidine kinase
MRLLQVGLRTLLIYALVLVILSIPVSLFSIRQILNEEVDETLAAHTDQFLHHIKRFTYLDDLETDLEVLDHLSYNIHIKPSDALKLERHYQTIMVYDSMEHELRPFRQLSSGVDIKGKPYILTVQLSLVDNDQLVLVIGLVQTVLIILLVAGLLFLNRSLSKKLWRPFYNTINQLKAYQLDKNKSIETETTNIIEFDDLNKTITHLTDRNRKIYLQQKEFIENASHELQTPLAIFQSKLDLLMQSPNLSESSASTIMDMEATAQRMARLNKNLLLLSRIDNEQFPNKEEIELSSLIRDLLTNLKPVAEIEHIRFNVDVNELKIISNRSLIEILLTNLFHNAIRHTISNSTIIVKLKGNLLQVSNPGTPLKMSTGKMFERFSKENTNTASTGLGLAIVKKICDTYIYHLQYHFADGVHEFSVVFQ